MATLLASVSLDAPTTDLNLAETDTFTMTAGLTWSGGHGGNETATTYFEWSTTSGSGFATIPASGLELTTADTNPASLTSSPASITVTCVGQGTYYLRMRAVGSSSFTSAEQVLTVNAAAGVDDLLADDIESASETETVSVGQEHVLLADDIESASNVETVSLGQAHALTATSIESASEVSAPTAAESHVLLADDISSLTEVSSPALAQDHSLLADDVQSLSEVGSPVIAQIHSLLAVSIESLSEVTSPIIAETHAITAVSIESASEVSAPALTVKTSLLAEDIESASEVTTPVIGQSYALSGVSIESASEVTKPTAISFTLVAKVTVLGGKSLTNLTYCVMDSFNISTASIIKQGVGEDTDSSGVLSIDLTGTSAIVDDELTIIITDYTDAVTDSNNGAVCFSLAEVV